MRFVLLALVSVLLAPASQAAPVPKEILQKFPDYYPLLPGTEWEYLAGEIAVTVKVKGYTEKAGVRTGTLSTEVNGAEVATKRCALTKRASIARTSTAPRSSRRS